MDGKTNVAFAASKTRVYSASDISYNSKAGAYISGLVLARLITAVQQALEPEISLSDPTCYTDSQVSLCWIQGESKVWKQFVQNRVEEIKKLSPWSNLEALQGN